MISETIQNNDSNGIPLTKRRLLYIDLIKAWAIICVVMGHLLIFNFYSIGDDSVLFGLIYSFHLPLFAFASGLVTNVSKFCFTKRIKILVPLFCFGLAYTYLIGKDLSYFLYDDMKCGYWWLWVMAIFYVCLYVIKKTHIKQIAGLCLIEVLFVLLNHFLPIDVKNMCCIASCAGLWPWLCLGILFNKKTGYLLGNHNNFGMFAIGIFWLLAFWTNATVHIKGLHYLVSLFAVIFFVWLFYSLDKKQYALTKKWGGKLDSSLCKYTCRIIG